MSEWQPAITVAAHGVIPKHAKLVNKKVMVREIETVQPAPYSTHPCRGKGRWFEIKGSNVRCCEHEILTD